MKLLFRGATPRLRKKILFVSELKFSGHTLIEIMISIMISSLVISEILKIYINTITNNQKENSLNLLQENYYYLAELIKKEIGKTKITSCAKLTKDFPFKNTTQFSLTTTNRINIVTIAKMDTLNLWYGNFIGASLVGDMQNLTNLNVQSTSQLKENNVLLIADCKSMDAFLIKKIYGLGNGIYKIITYQPLSKKYANFTEIYQLNIRKFFVKKAGLKQSLYMSDLKSPPLELMEGIERMTLSYDHNFNNSIIGLYFKFKMNSPHTKDLLNNGYLYVAL